MESHHSFIHLLTPQVLLSTTCQAPAILGLHQHVQQTWSPPLKPTACEGTTTTKKSISMVSTVLNEAVQGARDPVNRKLDPRLEGRVFQAERISSEKALGWASAGEA